jgi:hypothetical protein
VQFDRVGTDFRGGVDLVGLSVHEQRDFGHPGVEELSYHGAHTLHLRRDVEAPFRRDFRATLWDERGELWSIPTADGYNLGSEGQLEIQPRIKVLPEILHVSIGDMAAVFTQMEHDAVSSGREAGASRVERTRKRLPPRVPKRGDVIDIYQKFAQRRFQSGNSPSARRS